MSQNDYSILYSEMSIKEVKITTLQVEATPKKNPPKKKGTPRSKKKTTISRTTYRKTEER
jgi:hypothetical protein